MMAWMAYWLGIVLLSKTPVPIWDKDSCLLMHGSVCNPILHAQLDKGQRLKQDDMKTGFIKLGSNHFDKIGTTLIKACY